MDQAKVIHIWGTIADEAGYQALKLAGWDSQSYDSLWRGSLERTADANVIQETVENTPPGQNGSQFVSITKVELAYLVPQNTQVEQNLSDPFALRTLQPVWCFSGRAANGDLVQAFVQAVEPGMISK